MQGLPHIRSLFASNTSDNPFDAENARVTGEDVANAAADVSPSLSPAHTAADRPPSTPTALSSHMDDVTVLRTQSESKRQLERAQSMLREDVRKFYSELGPCAPLPTADLLFDALLMFACMFASQRTVWMKLRLLSSTCSSVSLGNRKPAPLHGQLR